MLYKTTSFYNGAFDRAIAWDDPDIAIDWPVTGEVLLSEKDRFAPRVDAAELFDRGG